MAGYDDPKSKGNSSKYWTGKTCIEPGCYGPAGTAWGPYWCFKHNVERINRVDAQLVKIRDELKEQSWNTLTKK